MLITAAIFTFILSGFLFFCFATTLLKPSSSEKASLLVLSLGMGPILISWVFHFSLLLIPGQEDWFYIIIVVLSFGIIGVFSRHTLVSFLGGKSTFWQAPKAFITSQSVLSVCIIIACIMLLVIQWQISLLPLSENDAIQYMHVAGLIYQQKSIAFYPLVTADPASGFYATSSHPLGYMTLISWLFTVQGGIFQSGLIKSINPLYLIYMSISLAYFLRKYGKLASLSGVLFLIATPILFKQSSEGSIDPFRCFHFFQCFLWIGLIREKKRAIWFVFPGIWIGMSMFSHSINGAFSGLFWAITFFVCSSLYWKDKIKYIALIGAIAALVGSYQYVKNIQIFGTPIQDDLPVLKLESIKHQEWVRSGRGLMSLTDRIAKGLLKGFTKIKTFGLVYWFAVFGIIASLVRRNSGDDYLAVPIGLFLFLVIYSMMIGNDVFIANDRYYLTIQPFIAYWGAIGLCFILEKVLGSQDSSNEHAISRTNVVVFLILILGVNIGGASAVIQFAKKEFSKPVLSSDAAVVLFSGFENNIYLDEETKLRLNHAKQLYDTRKVHRIICVGGYRSDSDAFGGLLMQDYLISLKTPNEQIYAGKGSFETFGNISEAYSISKQYDIESLIFVSSPVHLLRVRGIAGRIPHLKVQYSGYKKNEMDFFQTGSQILQVYHEVVSLVAFKYLTRDQYIKFIRFLRDVSEKIK